jgi:cell division septum initiation protein DivIVA
MASFLPPAIFEIKAVADQAIAEFKKVNGELEKMEDKATKAGASVSKIDSASRVATAGLLAAGAAFAGFAAIGIKEAMDAEVQLTKLGQTLTNFGVNTEKNRAQIKDLTDSYVDLGFGGDVAMGAFNTLLTTTGDLSKSQDLLALSADLARTKQIDLGSAASILSKASIGNAKAFKEMGIELDANLPKQQAIDKAMAQLTARIGGQAQAATKTFAVQLQILKEKVLDIAESLGATLIPIIQKFIGFVGDAINFVKKHSEAFKLIGAIIIGVTLALVAYNVTTKAVTAATKAWTVITTVQTALTKLLKGEQMALNATMKANPIGLVVAGIMLLGVAVVYLWNKFEWFRKGVVKIFQIVVNGVGYLIGYIGTLLTIASKIPGIGDKFKGPAKAVNEAANKVREFSDGLNKLTDKKVKVGVELASPQISDFGVGAGKGTGTGGGTKLDPKVKAANEKYMGTVKDLQDKITSATQKANEKLIELAADYADKVANLQTEAADKIARLMRDADEKRFKAKVDMDKKITDAQKRFNDTMGDLNKKLAKDQAKLEEDNAKAIQNIKKENADKLQSIVQQSIDRLRDAYKNGTAFSVGDLFKGLVESGKSSADDLIKALRTKLDGARLLAENAGRLASLGYSQTFIEQVVAQGPDLGNALATSLLKSGTSTTDELQTIYKELETLNESGLNTLATKFNEGNILATSELNAAYASAKAELSVFLSDQQIQYQNSQAELMLVFTESMAESEKTRDEAIATARQDYAETIAEINKTLAQDIADVQTELAKSMADALKEYNKSVADVQKELSKALAEIQKVFQEKLANITNAVNATKSAIASLVTQLQLAIALSASLTSNQAKSLTTTTTSGSGGTTGGGTTQQVNNNTNVQISTTNLTSPQDVANATISAIKYGQAVVVAPVGAV